MWIKKNWVWVSLFIVLAALGVSDFAEASNGPPDNRPPENRPPDRGGNNEIDIRNAALAHSSATATSDAAALAAAEGGAATSLAAGGSVGDVSGGSGGAGGAGGRGGLAESSSGGNQLRGGDYESSYLNLALAPVSIADCIVANHVGGGGDGGGGLIQWGMVNKTCMLNKMADAERHVQTRARLKCAAKEYRNAIAFEQPRKERQRYCVDWTIQVTQGEIDYLAQLLEGQEEVLVELPK